MSTFYVARTYSHTNSRLLWKVESRAFYSAEGTRDHAKDLADAYCSFAQAEWNREHPKWPCHFFVVERA